MTTELAKALSEFQSKCPKIDLDGQVKFKGVDFKYATLGNILDKIRKPMKEAGLAFTQVIDNESGTLITTVICVSDGQSIQSRMPINLSGDPKGIGGNITYFRRYSLVTILGIVAEDDKDHEGTENSGKPQPTESQFQTTIQKIMNGEQGIFEKALSAFALNPHQIRKLVEAENTAKDE